MPPRRSARAGAVVERTCSALAPLSLPLAQRVFAALPVDARARCALVARGWHASLKERSLWTRLDMRGMSCKNADAALRAAAARAGGALLALDVADVHAISDAAILDVVSANGGTLRELCILRCNQRPQDARGRLEAVEALLRAAPQLQTFRADVVCDGFSDARRVLRNEAPFAPLRVLELEVEANQEKDQDATAVVALAADLAVHASLTALALSAAPLHKPAALDAVVDAALEGRYKMLALYSCSLTPASVPALCRLLDGALTTLSIYNCTSLLLDAPAAAPFGHALRASTLTSLELSELDFWGDAAAAAAVLGALTAHPTLRQLWLQHNPFAGAHQVAAGAALGALVAANAPALQILGVTGCSSPEDGVGPPADALLGPLFAALPRNTHLHSICVRRNRFTEAFARESALPAVRENSSLRCLEVDGTTEHAIEAMALVARR
jgi:hypothetical protein